MVFICWVIQPKYAVALVNTWFPSPQTVEVRLPRRLVNPARCHAPLYRTRAGPPESPKQGDAALVATAHKSPRDHPAQFQLAEIRVSSCFSRMDPVSAPLLGVV